MSKKLATAGALIVLIVPTVTACAALASATASRAEALRYRVIGHAKTYDVIRTHKRALVVRGYPTLGPTESPGPSPTPSDTATPTTSPTPTATLTFGPSPTPTPTAPPTPTAASGHPGLILTQSDIGAIRSELAASHEPQKSAWSTFLSGRVSSALNGTPAVVAGPLTSGDVRSTLELALDKDGAAARNLALAYAMTGSSTYAAKARTYLLAWAQGNTPTTYADCGDKWFGSYQAHGAFMLAYAYDLLYDSGALSAADKTTIEAYFHRFVDTLDTYNAHLRQEWVIGNPSYELPYVWDATRHYRVYDNYVGGDMVLLQQAARLAMARVIGYTTVVDAILNSTDDILRLENITKCSLSPVNDGDGLAGHPIPVPQVNVYKKPTAGRGGTIDYMTYNTRVDAVLLELAQNAGWDSTKTTTLRARLHTSWTYLARYFGPSAEPPFIAGDAPCISVDVPRFALAYRDFGDAQFLDVLQSSDRSTYYEPQLLGPVTLTHSITR